MVSYENILGIRDDTFPQQPRRQASEVGGRRTNGKRPREARTPDPNEHEKKRRKEEMRLQKLKEERERIFVGVDFGTTYSGVAYANASAENPQVNVIHTWNGCQDKQLEKVPSRIAYASENQELKTNLCGHAVKPGHKSCQWFKLHLDSNTDVSEFDDKRLSKCIGDGLLHLPDGKPATVVTTDYLAFLYNHTIETLESALTKRVVNATPFVFILTLPATWGPAARDATRQAAIDAGFKSRSHDEVVLVDEPEAAAVCAMKSAIQANPKDLQPFQQGKCVLVVDLGGGTVDCITYRVVKPSPLELEEACVGEGGKCGATSIDRAFWDFMSKIFGPAFEEIPTEKRASGSRMMREFEEHKRSFGGAHQERKRYEVPIRLRKVDLDDENVRKYYDDEEGEVRFWSDDLEQMFEEVVVNSLRLTKEQIHRCKKAKMPSIQAIVLCGGLGSSPYIKYRFEKFIKEELQKDIDVITPEHAWSAIARGAVTRMLEKPPVVFTRARDNIGICVSKPFDKGVHLDEDRFIDEDGNARARNQMELHVERGEKIRTTTRKIIPCFVPLTLSKAGARKKVIVKQDLFACSDDEPSMRLDSTWREIGKLKMDLTDAVAAERKIMDRIESRYAKQVIKIDVKVELTPTSDKGILEVVGKIGVRKVVGAVTIEYEADPEARR